MPHSRGPIVQLETQRYKQVVTLYSYTSQPETIVQLEKQRYKQVVRLYSYAS